MTRPGQAQAQLLPQAVDPLAIDGPPRAPEPRPGPAIAVTGVPLGQVPQPLAEGFDPAPRGRYRRLDRSRCSSRQARRSEPPRPHREATASLRSATVTIFF